MNTSTTPHTPLETVLLFRGIAQYGLKDDDFVRVSEALQNNGLIKNGPTYDARRLTPETLRDLFLRLLRDELRTESEKKPGPDGALSPASKKRRLQSPPLLTLADARQHIDKIEAAYTKLHNTYLRHAVQEIRQYEQKYEQLQGEIGDLEKPGAPRSESEAKSLNQSAAQAAGKQDEGSANGVGPSPAGSPKHPQIPTAPVSASQHPPPRNLQPLLPQPGPQRDIKVSPSSPSPSLLPQAGPERASTAPRSPVPAPPEAVGSSQSGQQEAPKTPATRPTATPKPPNGAPHQVLQAPQGVTPFQHSLQSSAPANAADSLQRPELAAGLKQAPTQPPTNAQPPAQGQLKWEPPYQPNAPPRHVSNTNPPQPTQVLPPQSEHPPPQRPFQQPSSHAGPGPVQGQASSRPLPPQQVLVPPHSASQSTPPLQSPSVKSQADAVAGPNKKQSLPPPKQPAGSGPQAQPPIQPQYQGYPVSAQRPATPGHPASQAQSTSVQPGPGRAPGIPSAPTPPVTAPPKPGPGLTAPQHLQQAPAMHPPSYNQQHAQRGAPSPIPAHPEGPQRYSSPYQQPRSAAVDRIHPRNSVTSTPTPAARFSPAPSAPQTPATAVPPRLAGGSGTKWVSNSTPSTPKPGVEFRLGYDDVPSPAYEPTSPVQRPSVPSGDKESHKRERPAAETPKAKPGRPPASQKAQGVSTPQPGVRPPPNQPAKSPAKQAAIVESEPPQVKHEVSTPRPSTEAGDTTADESISGRPPLPRSTKRKREDLTPTPAQTPRTSQQRDTSPDHLAASTDGPNLVLWTRSFNKVCGSAMEQIVHHRFANMFVAPIREKDAPGYHKVVKQAQDLKTIRAAINHGNRAAAQAAAALPDGDPGTSSVWLPRTEDLVPPKSIINSSQLDRELAHMFSNAVMYNPDPHHGPGPAFLRSEVDDEEEEGGAGADGAGASGGGHGHAHDSGVLGYKVDEFGVVNDARAMFVEVEKLLSELRSAEVRRNVPPGGLHHLGGGGAGTGTSTRQASVLGSHGGGGAGAGGESGKDEGDGGEDGDGDGGDAGEGVGGTVKRRRIGRG
ncbi:hypothetical protein VTI28DRAFT_2258 [Corynascus sepedonium]